MAAVAERFYRERGRRRDRSPALPSRGTATARRRGYPAGRGRPSGARTKRASRRPCGRLALAEAAGPDDLVLVLLSGGGSANWIAPAGDAHASPRSRASPVRCCARARASARSTRVRKHLSRIKGGRLARAAAPARVLTLAISDVPHDDPAVIASGPTVPDPSTLADARAIVARRGLDLPAAAARPPRRSRRCETPKPGDPVFSREPNSASSRARPTPSLPRPPRRADAGYEPIVLGADLEGEAREVAAEHAAHGPRSRGRRAGAPPSSRAAS